MTPIAPADHLRLVYREAFRAARKRGDARESHIGAGYLGLVTASERYDASRGRFSGFAVPHIRGAILDAERRDASRWEPPTFDPPDDRASALDELTRASLIASVRSAVAAAPLTRLERVVLFRRYWGDEKGVETARQLSCSEGRISQILRDAYVKLRPHLARCA